MYLLWIYFKKESEPFSIALQLFLLAEGQISATPWTHNDLDQIKDRYSISSMLLSGIYFMEK